MTAVGKSNTAFQLNDPVCLNYPTEGSSANRGQAVEMAHQLRASTVLPETQVWFPEPMLGDSQPLVTSATEDPTSFPGFEGHLVSIADIQRQSHMPINKK